MTTSTISSKALVLHGPKDLRLVRFLDHSGYEMLVTNTAPSNFRNRNKSLHLQAQNCKSRSAEQESADQTSIIIPTAAMVISLSGNQWSWDMSLGEL